MTTAHHVRSLGEHGFTLVELIITTAIIAVLGAIAISTFAEYRENAIFSKAQNDMRNARTALEAGIDDLAGLGFIDESSGTIGGPVAGDMAVALPAMVTSEGVMVRVMLHDCGFGGKTMVHMFSYACAPELATVWFRTCGDFEWQISQMATPGIC